MSLLTITESSWTKIKEVLASVPHELAADLEHIETVLGLKAKVATEVESLETKVEGDLKAEAELPAGGAASAPEVAAKALEEASEATGL
jgi:hypothetical protein